MNVSWSSGLGSLFLLMELAAAVFLGRASPHIPSACGTIDATAALARESALLDVFKPARGRLKTAAVKTDFAKQKKTRLDGADEVLPTFIFALATAKPVKPSGAVVSFKVPADPVICFSESARAPPAARRLD